MPVTLEVTCIVSLSYSAGFDQQLLAGEHNSIYQGSIANHSSLACFWRALCGVDRTEQCSENHLSHTEEQCELGSK